MLKSELGNRKKSWWLAEWGPPRCRGLFRGFASPAVLCHKEPARDKQNTPQFCVPKPLLGGFGCPSWFYLA